MSLHSQTSESSTETLLMAYADGQLDVAEQARVKRMLAANPSLQTKVDDYHLSAALAQQHWSESEPAIPYALRNTVQDMIAKANTSQPSEWLKPSVLPNALPAPNHWQQRPAANNSWYAMVATVACVAVGTLAYLAGAQQIGSGQQLNIHNNAAIALTVDASQSSQWQQHLSQSPSGVALALTGALSNQQLKILATVKDAQGRLCREFSLADSVGNTQGVACHRPSAQPHWQLQFAAHLPLEANGFTPASSAAVLDTFVTSIGAGAALSAAEERKALESLAPKP